MKLLLSPSTHKCKYYCWPLYLDRSKCNVRPGVVVKARGASIPEAEVEGPWVKGQPRLNCETWSKAKQKHSLRLRVWDNWQSAYRAQMKSWVQYLAPSNLKLGVRCGPVPQRSAGRRRMITGSEELKTGTQSKRRSLLFASSFLDTVNYHEKRLLCPNRKTTHPLSGTEVAPCKAN